MSFGQDESFGFPARRPESAVVATAGLKSSSVLRKVCSDAHYGASNASALIGGIFRSFRPGEVISERHYASIERIHRGTRDKIFAKSDLAICESDAQNAGEGRRCLLLRMWNSSIMRPLASTIRKD